jgi:predicted nucleotidyltransferase
MTTAKKKQSSRAEVEPLAADRKWPSEQARAWALTEIPRLCASPEVCAVVLFGSIVRNVAASSDLDVLYVYGSVAPQHGKPPIDVDLRRFRRAEVDGELRKGSDLLGWCIRYGELVCERNGYWTNLVKEWKDKIELPSAPVALERARKAERLLKEVASVGDDDAALELYLTVLTHLGRARLIEGGIYPASRPELPGQLRRARDAKLADLLQEAIELRDSIVQGAPAPHRKPWLDYLKPIEQDAVHGTSK